MAMASACSMRGAGEVVYYAALSTSQLPHGPRMSVSDIAKKVSSAAHAGQDATVPHWIGGRAVPGGGARLPVFDPATGAVTRQVALATAADVQAAVASAASSPARLVADPAGAARACPEPLSALLNERARRARGTHYQRARQGVR